MRTYPTAVQSTRQEPSEKPQFQFREETPVRGWWLDCLCTGELNKNDFLILSIVHAYTQTSGKCWASNAYLAKRLGITPHAASQCVKRLVTKRFLVRVFEGEARYLKSATIKPTDEQLDTSTAGATPPSTAGATRRYSFGIPLKEEGEAVRPTADPAAPRRLNSVRRTTPASKPTTNPPPKEEAPVPIQSDLGYLPPAKDSKPPLVEEVDHQWSQKLKEFVRAKGRRVRRSKKCWEIAFSRLRRDLPPHERGRIGEVLDAFIALDPPKPTIACAAEFRDRWEWVNDVVRKAGGCTPAQKVSPAAREVAANLISAKHWPAAMKDQLPAAVQSAFDFISDFRTRIATSSDKRTAYLARKLVWYFSDVWESTRQWFEGVAEMIHELDRKGGFRGTLAGQVPSLTNKRFLAHLAKLAAEFDSSDDLQNLLKGVES